MRIVRVVMFAAALALPAVLSAAQGSADGGPHTAHAAAVDSPLVDEVRLATEQFRDVGNAGPAGYGPALGCVSGPDEGAMGVHFINPSLLNAVLDPGQPEALIYEFKDG